MTIPAMNVFFDANLSYDCRMKISPEPITASVTVLSQMFLYLDSLKVDLDGFLHSLDSESTVEYKRVFSCPMRFGQKDNSMTFEWSGITPREYCENKYYQMEG
jgi:hypothetical protein